MSPRREEPARAAVAKTEQPAVLKIEQHREEFLAPGSVEYGIGSGASTRWLTPEDLEQEFGEKGEIRFDSDAGENDVLICVVFRFSCAKNGKHLCFFPCAVCLMFLQIDDYDLDSVNNMKRSLEQSAKQTAISNSAKSNSANSSSPPPPIPNRSNRAGKEEALSPRSKPAETTSKPAETAIPAKHSQQPQDKKQLYKDKLATLKDLHNDGLIDKAEYDARRNALVDEMLNSPN